MAEEDDILDELEAAEAPGAKKKPMGMIIGIIVGLLALGGGGYYAYITYFQEKPVKEVPVEGEVGEVEESVNLGVMFPLDPFIVNLAGSQGKRFLKVTISLELSTPEVHAELKENMQKVTDSILVLLSSKSFEDVYSVRGKFKLKDEVTTRVNRFLVVGHVKDAYFTEFIIQ
jgi:flagellar protein FliL